MEEDKEVICIVGLGNPGALYTKTRHNIGAFFVETLAQKFEASPLKRVSEVKGHLAIGNIEGFRVCFLLPLTYVNESGACVKRWLQYYQGSLDRLVVVCDDVETPFGQCKWKKTGNSGGHNGLKSIEQQLQTREYLRLKMGVGRPPAGSDLADYVLSPFLTEELEAIPEVFEKGETMIQEWILQVNTK